MPVAYRHKTDDKTREHNELPRFHGSKFVRPDGFEPPTTWFEALRSNEVTPRDAASRGTYSSLIACPPNWLRMADNSLSVNESASRERRRSSNDRVMTDAGTPNSMASATVQRPSPESATYGAIPCEVGFFSSASS